MVEVQNPNYLKDKYVRFSYRYRSEDGEYSLMAPFTQVLYIPNQNGYFLNEDESSAYRSTVVSWMENYINNVVLNIELPDTGNNIDSSYKIIILVPSKNEIKLLKDLQYYEKAQQFNFDIIDIEDLNKITS